MSKSSVIFGIVCLVFQIQTWALGEATTEFVPLGPTTVSPGTSVAFSINILPGTVSYNSMMLVIGTDASGIDFQFSDDWKTLFTETHDFMADTLFYKDNQHGIVVWSFLGLEKAPVTTAMTLGTVTLSTAGLAETSCWVKIDPTVDDVSGLSGDGSRTPLSGEAQITVVPEPGTLILLGWAFCGLTLRKWTTIRPSNTRKMKSQKK